MSGDQDSIIPNLRARVYAHIYIEKVFWQFAVQPVSKISLK